MKNKVSCALFSAALAAASVCVLAASPGERDFDGDGRADLLWRHEVTGDNYLYPMNVTAVKATEGYVRRVPDTNWKIVATGNFDGINGADILWRNTATGENYVYLMGGDGKTIVGEGYVRTIPDLNWKVVGAGDFDGDGRSDILWRHSSTGENYIFLMNGTTILSEGYVRTIPDPNWEVAGVGNFDGNATNPQTADILWRNRATGENYIFLMNGTAISGEGYVRTVPDLNWKIAGVGDFDGDGRADILWRNTATGENYIFAMSGLAITTGEGYTRTVPDQNWQVARVGNFDGNATTPQTDDILWRNAGSGQNYLYPMMGRNVLPSEGFVRTVADRQWKVQPAVAECPSVTSSAMVLSAVATRVSGVAPLAVWFDATATTHSTITASRVFHDIDYQWDFGDPGSGTWTRTPDMPNLSRNLAEGPVAAHVFERPGTYNVCLTAFDGTNTASKSVQITVQDPDQIYSGNKTVCVKSGAGTFDGCPAGATQTTNTNFGTALNANKGTNKRILFRRGDSFDAGNGNMNVQGPWTIGAFGPAVNPPTVNGSVELLVIGSPTTPNIKDGRVMDIKFQGTGVAENIGIEPEGSFQRVTFLRIAIDNVQFALAINDAVLDFLNGTANNGHQLFDEIAVVDSAVTTITNLGYGWFGAAQHIALLGNSFSNNPGGQHMIRITHTKKSVISHNSLSGAAPTKAVLKIHAMDWTTSGLANPNGVGTFTEQVVVSNNKLIGGGTGVVWPFTFAVTNPGGPGDERLRDFIVEKNWFTANPGQLVALHVQFARSVIRNNLFNLSGADDHTAIYLVGSENTSPVSSDVHVYNNTIYSGDASNDFLGVVITGGATNNVVRNNLAYSPLDSQHQMLDITSGTTQSNNSTNLQASPGFVTLPPSLPADFRVNPGSAVAGAPVPVYSDFFQLSRPQRGTFSRGAAENQ